MYGNMPFIVISAGPDNNLDILVEKREKPHQSFDRKAIEPVIDQRGDLRLRNAEQSTGGNLS